MTYATNDYAYKSGDRVVLIEDKHYLGRIIRKGTFAVIKQVTQRGYDIVDNTGNLAKCNFSGFQKVISSPKTPKGL